MSGHAQSNFAYRGQKLRISGNGTFSKSIEPGATVFLQVKYGLITLIKQEADLCDNLPKIDITCPVDKGLFTLDKEVDIPKQIVSSEAKGSHRDKLLTCIPATREVYRPCRCQYRRQRKGHLYGEHRRL